MTIHSDHPFASEPGERNPVRRFRGRMPSPVSIWTTQHDGRRTGWTLSSFLVADGEPAEVLGVVDEDSDLADALRAGANSDLGVPFAVNLLTWQFRGLADAFAGVAPAPGGPFRLAGWAESAWGPVLEGAPAWIGARMRTQPMHAGWGLLVRAEIEHVEIAPDTDAALLAYVRGRYRPID